jgi:hypothetical protein
VEVSRLPDAEPGLEEATHSPIANGSLEAQDGVDWRADRRFQRSTGRRCLLLGWLVCLDYLLARHFLYPFPSEKSS